MNLRSVLLFLTQNLLRSWTITSARETTLSANRWLDEWSRLQWMVANTTLSSRQSLDYSYGEQEAAYDFYSENEKWHHREKINPKFYPFLGDKAKPYSGSGKLEVTLNPMEIRTFVVTYQSNQKA